MAGGILNMDDLIALESIANAAQWNSQVARMIRGNIVSGTATSITDDQGNRVDGKTDVRDAFLRVISSIETVEHFWPISKLMAEIKVGEFSADYLGTNSSARVHSLID